MNAGANSHLLGQPDISLGAGADLLRFDEIIFTGGGVQCTPTTSPD
jgi:hypothetical protein